MTVDVSPGVNRTLKALAEPLRWQIVERLADEELCHLVADLGLAQPLVSHLLKALRAAGVVESERYRQWVYYRLRPDALADLAQALGELAAGAGPAGARRRPCS